MFFLSGCSHGDDSALKAPSHAVAQAPATSLKYKDYNVVFVSFDALQAAHVGCLGNARNVTPTLDAMARGGFNFMSTYSVASWTVPASMSWFTGVYPSEHRMTNKFALYTPTVQKPANLKELSPSLVTLAEILKHNGYATGFTTATDQIHSSTAGGNIGLGWQDDTVNKTVTVARTWSPSESA